MPDLIDPEANKGKKEFIIWPDECCKSCKANTVCPLMQVMYEYTILTLGGLHVTECALYDPDKESQYYIPPDPDLEVIKRANRETFQMQVDRLAEKVKNVDSGRFGTAGQSGSSL